MRSVRSVGRDTRGQAVIEFALVLPLLLILMISVWEFARAWNIQQVLTDAAREGARVAVVGNGKGQSTAQITPDVEDAVEQALSIAAIDPDDADIDLTGIGTGRGEPATVTIALPYRFAFLGPLMGWTIGKSSLTLRTSITMRNE
jgi:Flp pilus assembly protein TadG